MLKHYAAEEWAKSGLPTSSARSVVLPSRLASTPLKMVKDRPAHSERRAPYCSEMKLESQLHRARAANLVQRIEASALAAAS